MTLYYSEISMQEFNENRIPEKTKLHLGCGSRLLPGYINIDLNVPKTDSEGTQGFKFQKLDVRDIGKYYGEESVEEIRSEHLFEHFSRVEATAVLIQWTRIIREGGILSIQVPDFGAICKDFLDAPPGKKILFARHLEGDQAAEWAFHRVLWFKERFEMILPLMGYEYLRFNFVKWPHYPNLQNLTVQAQKHNKRSWEQLYVAGKEFLKTCMVSTAEHGTHTKWCFELDRMVKNARKTGQCRSNLTQEAGNAVYVPEKSKGTVSS